MKTTASLQNAIKCLNCGKQRQCVKIEARAPDANGLYEATGPMVEVCRSCLRDDIGTLAAYLLTNL